MDKTTRIGVREFQNRAGDDLSKGEMLAVERRGEVIGYYIPVSSDVAARRGALAAFEAKLEVFLKETELSEDELAEHLTIKREAGR